MDCGHRIGPAHLCHALAPPHEGDLDLPYLERMRVFAKKLVDLQPDVIASQTRRRSPHCSSGRRGRSRSYLWPSPTRSRRELRCESAPPVAGGPTNVDPEVAAIGPTQLREPLLEPGKPSLWLGIVFVERHQHTDTPQTCGLLCPHRERPRHRAPKPCNQLPPTHQSSQRRFRPDQLPLVPGRALRDGCRIELPSSMVILLWVK
jgi:hypothetical protein